MIDVHCHLEDFEKNRDELIEKSQKELKALITSCCHPDDFDLTMDLVEKYKNFVFATFSIHPVLIKEVSEDQIDDFFRKIEENKERVVGIGETGLDFVIEEPKFRERQKRLFLKFIQLANDLKRPLIIHARKAFLPTIEILEEKKVKNVLMHFFSAKELLSRIGKNGWPISVNTTLLSSKKIKKIVRDLPMEKIMTETDSPWLAFASKESEPRNIKFVIEKIAEIKKINFEEAKEITTENAIKFFNLPI